MLRVTTLFCYAHNRIRRMHHFSYPSLMHKPELQKALLALPVLGTRSNMRTRALRQPLQKQSWEGKKIQYIRKYIDIYTYNLRKMQVCCNLKAPQIEDVFSMIWHRVIDVLSLYNISSFMKKEMRSNAFLTPVP